MYAGKRALIDDELYRGGMANRLQDEKSPYLRQHAENPVDWHPYTEEAFLKAREADIPIFLSIGYSTCHWCHVMNRESFSDPEVAEALSGRFLPVKVDREARPDIDRIAMAACQLMTGSGGWPLTLILTPDKRPFFAATYLPKNPKYGSPGLLQMLDRISSFWQTKRDEALVLGVKVEEAVKAYLAGSIQARDPPSKNEQDNLPDTGYAALANQYDSTYGGFGTGMKFPAPHLLTFLLRYAGVTGNDEAAAMAIHTLHAMRRGAINDQVGGGFHRYATDPAWKIPHYEKMLTDQALLLTAFAEGFRVTRDLLLAAEAKRIADYMRTDLISSEGLFYTAEDAESGGEEGGLYLWSRDELLSALDREDGEWAVTHLHKDAQKQQRLPLGLPDEPVDQKRLETVRKKLALYRRQRPRPFRDEKILMDANGMAIAALARAGHLLSDTAMISAAVNAFDALQSILKAGGDVFFHARTDGANTREAYLPDHAELISAAIALHQATLEPHYLRFALDHIKSVIEKFYNADEGWFWFEETGEHLFRTRDLEDGAGPSGNAVMLHNLHLLHRITGDPGVREIADLMHTKIAALLLRQPTAYIHSIAAAHHRSSAAIDLIFVGDPLVFCESVRSSRNLLVTHLHLTGETASYFDERLPKALEYETNTGETIAYACTQTACFPPVTDPVELQSTLDSVFRLKPGFFQ